MNDIYSRMTYMLEDSHGCTERPQGVFSSSADIFWSSMEIPWMTKKEFLWTVAHMESPLPKKDMEEILQALS